MIDCAVENDESLVIDKGTNRLIPIGAASCYPASMVNLIWFVGVKCLKLYSCSHKNVQSDRIYVSLRIVGLSHVRSRQCTITPSLQDVKFFGSQDARFHVSMLLSADNRFHAIDKPKVAK